MTKKTSISLSPAIHEKWKQLADDDRRSMSSEFEWLVEQETIRRQQPKAPYVQSQEAQ